MATGAIVDTASAAGKSFRTARTVTSDGAVIKDPTLAAAKIGALTTRTDDDTGELTMNASHGITTGNRLDVYWSGGARYGMTVGTVATNQVPIDGGTGDVLPADETAITAMVPQLEDFAAPSASLDGLFVGCSVPAWVVFYQSDGTTLVKAVYVEDANDSYQWDADDPTAPASPFGADVAKAYFSHGSSAGSKQVNAVALVN